MSHEASGWAFRQDLPAKVKMVLVALADQANEDTGHVCYGQRHMKFLAQKSACGERTLYRYIAALVRNGYLIKDSGKTKGQENDLYLRLDRNAGEHGEWTWKVDDPEANEPQDIGSAKTDDKNKADKNWQTPSATKVADNKNLESTKNLRPADEKPKIGFSRQAQDLERVNAAPPPPDPDELVVVIEGTRWWGLMQAWWRRTKGRPLNGGYRLEGEHRGKSGRHFRRADIDAALKRESTGPPISPDGVNEEAAKEFSELAK